MKRSYSTETLGKKNTFYCFSFRNFFYFLDTTRKKQKFVVTFPFCAIPSESTKTFFKYPEILVSRLLPFYVDDGNLLLQLQEWMFTDSKETELFLIEDNLGLGKSTAPLAAASYQSIGYAVLETEWMY